MTADFVRTSGRSSKQVFGEIARELTVADLALLVPERGVKPISIKKLRDSHHNLARLVAEGRSGIEISQITGYSQSRISILKSDPAFAELVSFYAKNLEEMRDEITANAQQKLVAFYLDGIEEMHDRINDTPELVSFDSLVDSVKMAADRIGLGPQSKSTNVNVNLDLAERAAAGRRRADRPSAVDPGGPVTIESTINPDQVRLPGPGGGVDDA